MAKPPRYRLQDYTVGWLCAITPELTAARIMLDNRHGQPLDAPNHDTNSYHFGDINGHKVVIASMIVSSPGLGSAQKLIEPLRRTFCNMRLHLFVGIGGGIPRIPRPEDSLRDVHLGDVVISWPEKTGAPAIVQYDFYRSNAGGKEPELLKNFDKPDPQLLTSLGPMVSDLDLGISTFLAHLQKLDNREEFPGMKKDLFKHPGLENDRLFETKSDHVASGCHDCKPLVDRAKRVETHPQFHLGTILSGNTLVENAEERDKLSERFPDALCFEMEAAGVIDYTHCLVIRGISDYADSHRKSLGWHYYAAGTAAAFAREILCRIRPDTVNKFKQQEYTIQDLVDSLLEESKAFCNQFTRSDQFEVLYSALNCLKQARDVLAKSGISDNDRNVKILFRLITVEMDISCDNDINLDERFGHNCQANEYAKMALSYPNEKFVTLQLRLEQAFVQGGKVRLEGQRPNDIVTMKRNGKKALENIKARHTDLTNERPEKGRQYDKRVAHWEKQLPQ